MVVIFKLSPWQKIGIFLVGHFSWLSEADKD